MAWTSLAERLAHIPLILAGPIVRRVEPRSITIWLALKEARNVTLCIYDEQSQRQEKVRGTQASIRLGEHLHIVAVTAQIAKDQAALAWGQSYTYDLFFSEQSPDFTEKAGQMTATTAHLATPGILSVDPNETDPLQRIVYPGQTLPSFLVPAQDIHQLKIIHGSCRKPHGVGKEALSGLDTLLASAHAAGDLQARPQQLYMSGDQIYADDVATPLLHTLTDAGNTLLAGNQLEILPQIQLPTSKLLPGTRKLIIQNKARFTSTKADNHLIGLAEYLTMYLFAWSDVLWPEDLLSVEAFWSWLYPGVHAKDITQAKDQAHYREELERLQSFRQTLPKVRRALANIATYMICDDHDITDDWFLDGAWCQHVLKAPLGRRIIRNGLIAYAICQAWGNTPKQFAEPHGKDLLAAIDSWRGEESVPQVDIIDKAIGMPDPFKGQGSLQRSKRALKWNYSYEGPNYQIIVMDTRTQRHYRAPSDFPGLLSESAMLTQIDQIERPAAEATILISAAPVIGIDFVETVQFWSRWRVKDNYAFDREAWALEWGTFQSFLRTISNLKRVVFLSGDVHYAFGSNLEYWDTQTKKTAKVVNFTASPLCNEGSGSQISVLAIGYPRLRTFLQGGKEPALNFFVWDILGHDHYTLNHLLTAIHKRLYRFWWAIPRLIAAQRSPSEIVMPTWGWLKGTFDKLPPNRSYRLHYLQNTLNPADEREHRPHANLTRFTLRPLRAILREVNSLQKLTQRLRSTLQNQAGTQAESRPHLVSGTKENVREKIIEHTKKIERRLERPKTGLTRTVFTYENWLSRWKAGSLIVGYNNFGEISFDWTQEKKQVTQRLWWYNPEHPEQLQSTEYSDTLELPRPEDCPPLP